MFRKVYINARFLTQSVTGVQRFAIELAKILRSRVPNAVFIAPGNILDVELANQLKVQIVGYTTGVLWEQTELPIFLKAQGNPLLLNLCNVAPLFYKNQIVTIHDVAFYVNPKWFTRKFALSYKFLLPKLVKKARAILTVSSFSKEEIIKYLKADPEKITVVYNSASELVLNNNLTNQYGKYILVVGSIDKRKNLSKLIEAFNKIDKKDYKLIIAGDVSSIFNNADNNHIFENAADIVRLGRVSDEMLSCLYKNALVFIYPSIYEGFGIPPLEAMYWGCPTIVSNIPSLREVCGNASIYADPYSSESIRLAIQQVVDNEDVKRDIVARGRDRIKKYSWQNSAQIVAEIINKLNQQN